MSGDIDIFSNYLQLFLTVAAAAGVIIGAFKYFSRYIDNRVDDKLTPAVTEIDKQHEDLKHEVSLLQQSVIFLKEYFTKLVSIKQGNRKHEDE